jgi:integrase
MPPRYNRARRRWEIDEHVRLPNGKTKRLRRQSPINTKAAATKYAQQAVSALLDSSTSGKSGPAPNFEVFAVRDYLRKYAAGNNRASQVATAETICRVHLIKAFGKLALDEITPERIETYKAKKLVTHSPQTVKNHLTVLRKILRLAVEWGKLSAAPKIRMPKVPEAPYDHLSIEETDRLLAASVDPWVAPTCVGVRTGLRVGELCGLHWGDVDLVRGRLTVRHNIVSGRLQTTKSGKERVVPLTPDALATLRALPQRRGQPWVFGRGKLPMSRHGFAYGLEAACKRAKLRIISPHVLRHTFGSQLVASGAHLRVVQQLMGHSSIKVTERYAHLAPNATDQAIAALGQAVAAAAAGEGGSMVPNTGANTEQTSEKKGGLQ